MLRAGNTWLPQGDDYFPKYFEKGDVFEPKNLETGLKYVTEWDCAIDGGAHVGSWTRALAFKFKQVHAFEPQPDNYYCLIANTAALDNVRSYRTALGAVTGFVSLEPGTNSGCWHVGKGKGAQMMPLDDLLVLKKRQVGYLKLDVEGFEYHALSGARELIHRCRPVVQIEEKRLPHSYPGPTARSFLEGIGYKEADRSGRDVIFTC